MQETFYKEITKLFQLEPYSKERFNQLKVIKELEKQYNVEVYPHSINERHKNLICDILRKDKNGLYEELFQFRVRNIKIEER